MRKIFSFFAALLVAVAANAAVVNITPDGATDLRHAVRDKAAAGDTVVLADGVYTQGGDYTYFEKNIVVMAAEGANPVVKFTVPAQIKGGARAEFIGIKFDMENLHGQSWYEHLIYATDATAGNVLVFDGCEFYNDTLNNSVIYCSTSNLLDSIIVKDCKFHDIMKSCIFVESTAFKGLHISNSTFYNISTNITSYWAGVVDIRATGCELRVDHCTFYNVIPMNTDYSAVSKVAIANGIVSNCIFMLPTAQDGIRAMRGVTANNCITYNYLKDSGTGIHSSVTKNNCTQVDPLFKDAANGDFTLLENSPALTMNNGEPIGDLRWVASEEPQPETMTLYLKLSADWAGWPAKYAIYYFDDATNGWSDFMTAVEGEQNVYVGTIPAEYADDKIIFVRLNGEATEANWENKWSQTVDLEIPEGKDFFTVTSGGTDSECNGVWSKYGEEYVPALANGFYLVGTFNEVNAWEVGNLTAEKKFTVNPNDENEYTIVVDLAAGDKFKAVYVENDAIKTWYPEGSGNDYVVTEQTAGEKTIYFRPTYNEEWGGHFYIAPNVEPVEPAAPVLWKATAETPTAAGSTLINDDLLTLASVYESFVSGTNHTYGEEVFAKAFQVRAKNVPTAQNLTGEENETTDDTKKASPLVLTAKEDIEVTFYYRQQQTAETPAAENDNKDLWIYDQAAITAKLTGTHTSVDVSTDSKYAFVTKKMTFTKNHVYTLTAVGTTLPLFGLEYKATEGEGGEGEPTALTNTTSETKAVKTLKNGILVIEKAGVKYNVLGQTVR